MASFDTITELRTPERSGNEFSTSWRVMHAGGQVEWDNIDCVWFVNGKQHTSHYGQSEGMTSDSLRILNRNDYYPASGKPKLETVYARVRGTTNSAYDGLENKHWGNFVTSPKLTMKPPYEPELELEVDLGATEQEVQVKSTPASETPERELHDTTLTVVKKQNFGAVRESSLYSVTTDRADLLEKSFNISEIEAGLTEDRYVEVIATSYSRGYGGDSQRVSASHVFAWPGRPQITSVRISGTVEEAGMVLVGVKTNASKYHPTDLVQLERLKSKTAETAAQAALESGWDDVSNAEDDGDCEGLTDQLVNAYPAVEERTWYRIRAEHDEYILYSLPVDLGIYIPRPTGGDVTIINAVSCDDGTSVKVDIGWAADEGTATQVSWGKALTSWESTTAPGEYQFAWEDDVPAQGFGGSATVYITDLTEGERIYVRARRVVEGETTTYGEWSDPVPVTPVSAPAWVSLSAPAVIARGSSLPLTWTFGSEAAQTGWRVMDADGKVWAAGEDADGACSIPAERLADVESLTVKVSVTTGGDWKDSDYATITIAERPTCAVSAPQTVTSLPVQLAIETDAPGAWMALKAVSRGITYARPDGERVQFAGETVASWTAQPSWEAVSGGYGATVDMPDAELVNGCAYDVIAVAVDPSTGLRSEEASDSFTVAWATTATAPTFTVTPNPSALSAAIALGQGSGVVDVYRMTPDGAQLVAEGVSPGSTVTDRFAPFSGASLGIATSYRCAMRTPEGDAAWADVEYSLHHGGLRLDWGGSSVELAYNVAEEESFAKDFEARTHMDGVTEGFWAAGTTRSAALSTDLIRLSSPEQRVLLREMARYAGAVFVRAGNGIAFDADVQLSKMSESYNSGAVAVSLDCTPVALTDAHRCGPGDVVEGD